MPCRVRYQGILPRELSGLNELGIVGSSCWCTLLCSVIKHYLFLALSEVWPQTFQSALCPILPTLQPTEPGSGCPLWTLKHLKQKFKTKLVVTDIALFLWATSSPPSSVSDISLHLLKGPGHPLIILDTHILWTARACGIHPGTSPVRLILVLCHNHPDEICCHLKRSLQSLLGDHTRTFLSSLQQYFQTHIWQWPFLGFKNLQCFTDAVLISQVIILWLPWPSPSLLLAFVWVLSIALWERVWLQPKEVWLQPKASTGSLLFPSLEAS